MSLHVTAIDLSVKYLTNGHHFWQVDIITKKSPFRQSCLLVRCYLNLSDYDVDLSDNDVKLLTTLHLNMILFKKKIHAQKIWCVLLFSCSCNLVAVRCHSVWKVANCQRFYMHVRVCVRISFQRNGNSLIFWSNETCFWTYFIELFKRIRNKFWQLTSSSPYM